MKASAMKNTLYCSYLNTSSPPYTDAPPPYLHSYEGLQDKHELLLRTLNFPTNLSKIHK